MDYQAFLEYLLKITSAFPGLKSATPKPGIVLSATHCIPEAFIRLLPHVLPLLQANIHDFCKPYEVIVIIGLQRSACMYSIIEPYEHFCCTLDFYTTPKSDFDSGKSQYTQTKSVLIDFTSGRIYSEDSFLIVLEPPKKTVDDLSPPGPKTLSSTSQSGVPSARYPETLKQIANSRPAGREEQSPAKKEVNEKHAVAYNVWLEASVYGTIPAQAIDAAWSSIINSVATQTIAEARERYYGAYQWFKEFRAQMVEKTESRDTHKENNTTRNGVKFSQYPYCCHFSAESNPRPALTNSSDDIPAAPRFTPPIP